MQLFGLYFNFGMLHPFLLWFNIGMFKGLPARAIHLGFALTLAFLIYPTFKGKKISIFDIIISLLVLSAVSIFIFFMISLVDRGGVLLNITLEKILIYLLN